MPENYDVDDDVRTTAQRTHGKLVHDRPTSSLPRPSNVDKFMTKMGNSTDWKKSEV